MDVIQDFHVSESHHPKSSCEFWKRTPKFNWRDCLQNYIYWPAPISIEIRQVKKNISLSLSLSLLISLSKWEWEWEYEENEIKVKQKRRKAKQQWRGRGGKKKGEGWQLWVCHRDRQTQRHPFLFLSFSVKSRLSMRETLRDMSPSTFNQSCLLCLHTVSALPHLISLLLQSSHNSTMQLPPSFLFKLSMCTKYQHPFCLWASLYAWDTQEPNT